MHNEILFSETQRFKQWWLWLILLVVNGIFLLGVWQQVIGGQVFGDNPMGNTGLIIVTGLVLLLTALFAAFRLDTQIRKDGIYVRFFPFHLSYRHYSWDSLTKSYIRQYSAITEYGGWGLRLGYFGRGAAYNISGDTGLQLEFSNHKKLLIGTDKPAELTEILTKLGQIKQ